MPFLASKKRLIALASFGWRVSNVATHSHAHPPFDLEDEDLHQLHHESAVQEHSRMAGVERCSSAHPTLAEMWQDEENLKSWRQRAGCTLESCPPLEAEQQTTISVIWHNLQASDGTGGLTEAEILSSMNVLNDAFRNTSFSFNLTETITTAKDYYYYAPYGSAGISEMKNSLRKGDVATLNVYSNIQLDGTLGWATFPFLYIFAPKADGVVIDLNSVPGRDFFPYNEGDTLVHEVGHW
jgi:hypothetical protein